MAESQQSQPTTSFAGHAEATRDWVVEHAPALVGLGAVDAEAAVRAADLQPRTVRPGVPVTADLRSHRVNLLLDERERVREVTAG